VTKCAVVYEIDKCQIVLDDNEGGCRWWWYKWITYEL